jgi:hypothetical protein
MKEKSPSNPVHHTTLPTRSARRSTEVGGSRSTGGVVLVGLGRRGVDAAAADALVGHGPDPGREGVPGGHVGGHAVVEGDPLAVDRDRPPDQGDAGPGQGGQAEAAARGQDRLGGRHGRRVGQVGWPLVHEPGLDQPLDGLAAPVPEGEAPDRAGGQDHPPAGGQEVLGDLAAGLGAADDQHRPLRELAGMAVAGGVDLHDPVREGAGERGTPRPVLVAGGDDHGPGPDLAGVGAQGEAPPVGTSRVTPTPSRTGRPSASRPSRRTTSLPVR